MKHLYPHCYFEGKVTNVKNAKVPVMTKAFQYGQSIFGGIKGYYDPKDKTVNIFRLRDHFERMQQAVKIVPLNWKMSYKEFKGIFVQLTKKNKVRTDCYYRPNVYSADLTVTPIFSQAHDDFCLYVQPLGDYMDTVHGIKVMISSWRRVPDEVTSTKAKVAGAYVNSAMAKTEAVAHGFDDAILLNANGTVSEGSAANLFAVKDGVLITPPLSSNALAGITRRSVIELAREELGLEIQEKDFDRSSLYGMDELFFSGTAAQVTWIREVDGRKIGNGKMGPVTGKLKDLFLKVVRGDVEKYREKWLTEVRVG